MSMSLNTYEQKAIEGKSVKALSTVKLVFQNFVTERKFGSAEEISNRDRSCGRRLDASAS